MTIANAFKLFFKSLTGKEPVGTNIADVIREGTSNMDGPVGSVVLKSSTAGSSKVFSVTVDDTGTVTATEITE